MKSIFDKCKFGDFKLNSRIIRTGLWESQQKDLNAIYDRYDKIASSGVGLITSELFSIYPKDKFVEHSHRMDSTNFMVMASKMAEITHSYDVPILGQVEFIKYNRGIDLDISVNDLVMEDIRKIQSDIIAAAKKLEFAGFDGIQLALGNNFFLSRFINPYFNQRKDDYGQDTFGRMRIVLEAIKVIKDNYNLHVNIRINAYDGRKGGITEEESIKMCQLLEEYGADSIQITKPLSPLYFTPEEINNELIDYCEKLSENINIPLILGGGLTDKNRINSIINERNIDFVSMYRPFVAQKDFLLDWKENKESISRCKMCNNCYRRKNSTCYYFD